jgi:hypothetical protein
MAIGSRRPPALVLSRSGDRRLRAYSLLKSLGYDPLGFSSIVDAEAWLQEDTPGAAIVDSAPGRGAGRLLGILEERCVNLIAMDARRPHPPAA